MGSLLPIEELRSSSCPDGAHDLMGDIKKLVQLKLRWTVAYSTKKLWEAEEGQIMIQRNKIVRTLFLARREDVLRCLSRGRGLCFSVWIPHLHCSTQEMLEWLFSVLPKGIYRFRGKMVIYYIWMPGDIGA